MLLSPKSRRKFSKISAAASTTVKNLNIGENTESGKIKASIDQADNTVNFGFLAGYAGTGNDSKGYITHIENVNVYGNATEIESVSTKANYLRAGGILGWCANTTIKNSSFTGSISSNNTSSKMYICVGGIVGNPDSWGTNKLSLFIENCNVSADLTATRTTAAANHIEYVGGVVGLNNIAFLSIKNCNTSGKYNSYGYSGGVVGGVVKQRDIANASDTHTFIAKSCTSTSTLTGATKGDVYGYADGNARTYVDNCSESQNTPTLNLGAALPADFDSTKNYVWVINEASDFDLIGKADATVTDFTYPLNGIYRLGNGIEIDEGKVYSTPVVNETFSGVFDGNGYAITNLKMTITSGSRAGFFKELSTTTTAIAVVMDFDLGSADSYVELTTDQANVGTLTSWAVNAIISNVDVYADADCTFTGASAINMGGIVGRHYQVHYYECDVFGSITADAASRGHRTFVAGFSGYADTGLSEIYNCNNFSDITARVTGTTDKTDWVYTGGFFGYVANNTYFLNCNNLGSITNESTSLHTTTGGIAAGGFIGAAKVDATAVNCSNFGNVILNGSSAHREANAAAFIGGVADASANVNANLYNFEQYGAVTDNGTVSGTTTAYVVNTVKNGTYKEKIAIDMVNGASVRLAADTGLRFMADISLDAIAKLEDIFGEDATVSYGMLISPDKFIEKANGFTHKALEAYATEANGFAVGEKAYVDIPSVDNDGNKVWFNNQDGKVAGSVTELPVALYNTAFSGVAYITVTVDGVDVCTLYAADALSRTIYEVAKKALDDVETEVTTTDDGYVFDKQLEANETYYVDGVEKKVTTEVVYSCYSKTQRDTLNKIVTDFDGLAAN